MPETKPESQERIRIYKKRFLAADTNKDGKVNADEFVAYRQPHLFDYMHDLVITELEEEMDIDKDGKVTLKDRLAGWNNLTKDCVTRNHFKYLQRK